MISEDELLGLAAITIAEEPMEDRPEAESVITSILIGLIVNLVVEYIYRNCIQTKRLRYGDIIRVNAFRKIRLRGIIRDICNHHEIKETWDNHENQPSRIIGKIRVRTEYNPTLTFYQTRDEITKIVLAVGARLKPEDFN